MSDTSNYPLREHATGQVHASSGRPLETITSDAVDANNLSSADLQISAETLRAQAAIAHRAGYVQLSANLRRAAELTRVPNAEMLHMYETMRPGRASYQELIELAERLAHTYEASESAALVREAADTYRARGLLRP